MKCLFLLATNNLTGALRKRSCPIPKSFFGHLTCTSNQSAGEADLQAHPHRKYTQVQNTAQKVSWCERIGSGSSVGTLPRRIHRAKDFMYRNIFFSVTSVRIYLF